MGVKGSEMAGAVTGPPLSPGPSQDAALRTVAGQLQEKGFIVALDGHDVGHCDGSTAS